MSNESPGWFELHENGLRYGLMLGWVLMTLGVIRFWPESTEVAPVGPAQLTVSAGVDRYDVPLFKNAETWWVPPPISDIADIHRAACAAGVPLLVDGGSFAVVEVTADEVRLQGRHLPHAWLAVTRDGHVLVPQLTEALEPLMHYRRVQAERLPCTAATLDRVLVAPSRDVPDVVLAAVLRSVTLAGGQPDLLAVDTLQLARLDAGESLQWGRWDPVRLGYSFDLPPAEVDRPPADTAPVSHPGNWFL